ncbi:MAG: selenoprotein O, partial [Sphingomonadaceae bacterium]|nr:selenoprotein O [Sphingomonadaceae bacterium]
DEEDIALVQAIERALTETQMSIDRFLFDWAGGEPRGGGYAEEAFAPYRAVVAPYASALDLNDPYWADPEPCSMLIEEVEALWKPIADADDWAPVEAKIASVRRMGAALANRVSPAKEGFA